MAAKTSLAAAPDPEFVEGLCKWVDRFNLSRPKKDLNRDFSDGYLVAEIISNVHPSLVDLHNYPAVSDTKGKIHNWDTLRLKVLRKLNIKLTDQEIENLANWRVNAIETFLARLKTKLDAPAHKEDSATGVRVFATPDDASPGLPLAGKLIKDLGAEYKATLMKGPNENILDRGSTHENDEVKELFAHYDRISELEAKLAQLKITLRTKDKHIAELESQFSGPKK